jgi:serine protease Do
MVKTPSGLGSGFIITETGHVVTNAHVVQGETRISVTVFEKGKDGFDKRMYRKVRLLAVNSTYDLALLKIEQLDKDGKPEAKPQKFSKVYLGRMAELKVGDSVFAVGNPLGLERTTTQGIVSTKSRNFEGLTYIQTDAAVNPGNSGGPMFNLKGEVVGVINMRMLFSEGLNFAIPISRVKDFLRNRDAFAYDKDTPNTGYRYLLPPRRRVPATSAGGEKQENPRNLRARKDNR